MSIRPSSMNAVVTAYRRYAPIYDVLFGRILEPGRKRMATTLPTHEPVRILEIGVGTGLTLQHYPAQSSIVGIDVSPEMLHRAREAAARMPERRITIQHMDAEALEFDDGSFDCVTIPYVLSVTPDPGRLVSEARRVCKPGGRILIVNHFSGNKFWWLLERLVQSAADRIGFRSTFDFDQHILSHDWKVVSVQSVNLFGLSRLVTVENA